MLQTFPVTAEIPSGFEPTGEFRLPIPGEFYLRGYDGSVGMATSSGERVLILRPIFQWPDWIKPGVWIAMEEDGHWFAFDAEPQLDSFWHMAGRGESVFALSLTTFVPPPCDDWTKSKRQKPLA